MKKEERFVLDISKLQHISKEILKEASGCGADQAEVSIETNKGFSVSAREGSVDTVEYHQDKVIDITVYFGKRKGSSSLSDLSSKAIKEAVFAASHIAKFTDKDKDAGLAAKHELAFEYPKIEMSYPWSITVEKAIELTCECEREALAYDKRIIAAEDSRIVTADSLYLYANSHGFVGSFETSHHEISCVLIAKEKDEMQRDYSYTIAANPIQLESVSEIAKQAAQRTVQRLGSRRIRTTKTPVIFFAEEARGLLGHFAAAMQGSSIYRKSSFLVDQLDKKVFSPFVKIYEQPHLPDGLGSAPFDDDGVLTRPNVFIDNGILKQYALSVYSARKLGLQTTGNAGGVFNLTIESGNKKLSDLLKTMNKGLLITEMMGQGVNLVTGDYSRGASGYWIENGEIQFPVSEVTVAGKLQDIYANIIEVGGDVDLRGNIRTGSLLIEEMMVAGD